MKQTALKRDEEQVQALVNHLSETMTDPFDIEAHPPCLMNISTGERALLTQFLDFFSPSLTADSKESCTSLVACLPVEIFMRQGGWSII
jgi:hypothetical protein